MCTTILSHKRSPRQRPEVSPEIRQARIDRLHHLTQDDYDDLLRTVEKIWVFQSEQFDPREALNDALAYALDHYSGQGELSHFVTACAYHYVVRQWKKHHSRRSDLLDDDGLPPPYQAAYANDDPDVSEPLDACFVQRIAETIERIDENTDRLKYHHVKANALKLLASFVASVNHGVGIGMDEFEQTPMKAWRLKLGDASKRPPHNQKEAGKAIRLRAWSELGIHNDSFYPSRLALRNAALQVLRESGLSGDYNTHP